MTTHRIYKGPQKRLVERVIQSFPKCQGAPPKEAIFTPHTIADRFGKHYYTISDWLKNLEGKDLADEFGEQKWENIVIKNCGTVPKYYLDPKYEPGYYLAYTPPTLEEVRSTYRTIKEEIVSRRLIKLWDGLAKGIEILPGSVFGWENLRRRRIMIAQKIREAGLRSALTDAEFLRKIRESYLK